METTHWSTYSVVIYSDGGNADDKSLKGVTRDSQQRTGKRQQGSNNNSSLILSDSASWWNIVVLFITSLRKNLEPGIAAAYKISNQIIGFYAILASKFILNIWFKNEKFIMVTNHPNYDYVTPLMTNISTFFWSVNTSLIIRWESHIGKLGAWEDKIRAPGPQGGGWVSPFSGF